MPELPSRLQSRIVSAGLIVNKGKRPPPAPLAIYAWEPRGRQLGVRQSRTYKTGPLTVFKVLCSESLLLVWKYLSYPQQGHTTASIILRHTNGEYKTF